jgi:hypothetical protein
VHQVFKGHTQIRTQNAEGWNRVTGYR